MTWYTYVVNNSSVGVIIDFSDGPLNVEIAPGDQASDEYLNETQKDKAIKVTVEGVSKTFTVGGNRSALLVNGEGSNNKVLEVYRSVYGELETKEELLGYIIYG